MSAISVVVTFVLCVAAVVPENDVAEGPYAEAQCESVKGAVALIGRRFALAVVIVVDGAVVDVVVDVIVFVGVVVVDVVVVVVAVFC